MDFVIRIARLRRSAQKYLRDGVFLRPPDTGTGEATIPISRLSIYAGQHEAVQEYAKAAPIVLSSAWQSADGSVAVALANLSDETGSRATHTHGSRLSPRGAGRHPAHS